MADLRRTLYFAVQKNKQREPLILVRVNFSKPTPVTGVRELLLSFFCAEYFSLL